MRQTGANWSHEEIVWTVAAGVCNLRTVEREYGKGHGVALRSDSMPVVKRGRARLGPGRSGCELAYAWHAPHDVRVAVGCTAGLYDYLLARRPLLQPATGLQIIPDRQVGYEPCKLTFAHFRL